MVNNMLLQDSTSVYNTDIIFRNSQQFCFHGNNTLKAYTTVLMVYKGIPAHTNGSFVTTSQSGGSVIL